MPNWSQLLNQVEQYSDNISELNKLRDKYIADIASITNRNVITYYSGWLKSPNAPNIDINEQDKNAFMSCIYHLDQTKGLDIILHTPGGDIAAMEGIVNYLRSVFGTDIRAVIPQICMSAGSMIAISCKEIVMGKQSALGPIDPQYGGLACQTVLEEFSSAVADISNNPSSRDLWQVIFGKLNPTFITECKNAIHWAEQLVNTWLPSVNPNINMQNFLNVFLNHQNTFTHSRRISRDDCRALGLNILDLEGDQKLQDAVLSLHHCYMILFDKYNYSKAMENNIGSHYFQRFSAQ